jgi:hypothetical protein
VTSNVFPCPGPDDAGTLMPSIHRLEALTASALDASLSPLVGNAGRLWARRPLFCFELAGRTIGSEPQLEVR